MSFVTSGHPEKMGRRAIIPLLICLQVGLGTILPGFVTADSPVTYHVNGRFGNDRNNGRSVLSAWKTLAQANALVQPGDTVIVYGGTYRESIAPAVSGTPERRITYKAPSNQNVNIEGAELLLNLIHRSYITVEGMNFQNPSGAWGEIQSGNFNEIIGNTFTGNGPTPYYAGLYLYYGSTYNRIVNNEFRNWGDWATQWGDAIRLSRDADCTLIEGNRFVNAGHSLLGIDTSYNVVRNNYFENAWHKGIDMVWRVNPPWSPGDDFVARRNVLENNTFVRCKLGSTGEKGGAGVQMGSAETIFRRNVLVENERTGVIINGWDDAPNPYGNRLYHNTFVNNGTAQGHEQASAILVTQWGIPGVDISDNVIKNNIICKENAQKHQLHFYLFPREQFDAEYYQESSFMVAGNTINEKPIVEFTSLEGSQTIAYYQGRYSSFVKKNLSAEPLFVNVRAGDYQLRNGSPAIDAAVPLTTTISAGYGTIVTVEDASYFTDGYGLVPGDQVKIGSNPAVTVLDVNVDYGVLILSRTIRWFEGDPVYLGEYTGNGPDAGAFESAFAPPPPKSITVLSPNGGEQWTKGQVTPIRWNSANVDGMVRIELSRDGGSHYELIAASTPNRGEYEWTVSGAPTTSGIIRISGSEFLSINDTSDAAFTIKEPTSTPMVHLLSPNGGEEWTVDSEVTIRWTSGNLQGPVKIDLSRDGGQSFESISAGTPDDGAHEWVVKGAVTTRAVVRVTSTRMLSVFDASDGPFVIKEPPPPAQPSISVLSPNGGEELTLGQIRVIRWESAHVTGNVMIRYSRDGGRRFRTIAANAPNTGTYDWKPTGLGCQRTLIEITSKVDPTVKDVSDAVFTLKR